nr:protein argonaute-2-like isoform X1 [Vanessa tameamea]
MYKPAFSMGKGGKKKNKHSEKDIGASGTSSEIQPSTSQAPIAEVQKLNIADKPEPSEPKEECFGLGIEGSSKKRPRKKKKDDTSHGDDPSAQQMTGLTAAGPAQAFPKLSTGLGRGRGWAPSQMVPQAQVVPIQPIQPQVPVQPQVQPMCGWGAPQSTVQQHQQPPQRYFSATETSPQFAQPPTFSQPQSSGVGRSRGRGYAPDRSSDKTISFGSKSFETPNRLKIPTKCPGGIVTRQSRPLKLITNYLEMKIKPLKIYRYDVSIKPEKPKKLTPKAFMAVKKMKFPNHVVAFDQRKNCYSLTRLWNTSEERMNVNVELLDDNKVKMNFDVTMKATGVVDINTILQHMKNGESSLNPPTEAIQAIDVILQQGTLENYVKVGRQYFMRPKNPIDLFYGMEMWTGLFQSAIFTSRAFINIDVAHKAFPRYQSLIEALIKDFRLDPKKPLNQQRGVDYFEQFIKGLRVVARIGGGEKIREYICNGLVDPANRLTFPLNDPAEQGKTVTVEKYFEIDKKYRLRYPYLNCMWVGPKDKNIYYPMELLHISFGQPINKQLNEKQLQTMVREAATPPNERMNKIKEVTRNMNYSANASFKHFQLEVSDKFFQVDAKVLQAPKLDIGVGKPVDPRKGVWQANRFLKASALETWGLITIEADPTTCQCQSFIDMIKRVGVQMGMSVRDPLMTNFNVRMNEIHKILLTAYEKRINILFVIVPVRFRDAYEKVKRMAELEVGILTQCIKDMTASRRMSEQTVRNILLKVNSKLMGINQCLEARSVPECIKKGGVMMVGADVTHPPPDQKTIPSIAAVSASIGPKCFLYNIELSMQTPKEEIIVDFEDMMFDHLQNYRQRQNMLPRKIFVFRDGVSEGQFAQVMQSELVAIQKAYQRLDQQVKPEILFLLVQKRHHTRFFLGESNPQNVEPGTVVDSEIVHPRELDFYLVSHQALKGTARPTRYHVICNDGNIPSDEVEQLAYYLCHLYARCSRSVSYPAPTYYAHLACLRARTLTSGDRINNAELEKKPKRLRVLDRMLQHSRMFFV